jgi:hypothetical protein
MVPPSSFEACLSFPALSNTVQGPGLDAGKVKVGDIPLESHDHSVHWLGISLRRRKSSVRSISMCRCCMWPEHRKLPILRRNSDVAQVVQLRYRASGFFGQRAGDLATAQRGPLPDCRFPEPVPELVPVPPLRCWDLSQSFCAALWDVPPAVPSLMWAQSSGRGIVVPDPSGVVIDNKARTEMEHPMWTA